MRATIPRCQRVASERAITLHFDGPQISNIIALRSTKGIVVIDTESSPSLGRLLRSQIMEEFPGDTIRWVINTHGHGDHTRGNQAFAGAGIVGQENALQDMAEVAGDALGDAERIGSYLETLEARFGGTDPGGPEAADLDRTMSQRVAGKQPAFPVFRRALEERGIEEALAQLETLASDENLFLMESDLVSLGYRLLYREQAPADAVVVFKKLTSLFPESWNAWDCLGEASAELGDVELARSSYSRSLEMNPQNDPARAASMDSTQRTSSAKPRALPRPSLESPCA